MAKRRAPQGLITTRRRTKLDDGLVQFLHVLDDPALGPKRSALSFKPKTGELVLEESRPATGKKTIVFDLSWDEADTLAEALAVWRGIRRSRLPMDPIP